MLGCKRSLLALVLLATCGSPAAQAQLAWNERPKLFEPLRPLTQKESDRRESLKLFALGALYAREDRLLEAIEVFEKAGKLDPDATEILKTLIPLYIAVDRGADAMAATRKVLDLDPDDYEVWYLYARQLKAQGKTKEACASLQRGLAIGALKEHPEAAEPMYLLLGVLRENKDELAKAAEAYRQAAKILDHPDAIIEVAPLSRAAVALRAAELYEKIGGIYLKAKQYEEAVAAYRQAQARYPDGAGRLHFNLALVYEKQGSPSQALSSVESYLRLLPQGLEAYELKIKLMKALHRDAEILPWLKQASQNDRFNVGLKLLLARSYTQAQQTLQAEKIYADLAAKAPSAEVYRGLFRLYVDERRLGPGRALILLDKTVADAKNPPPLNGVNLAPAQADAMVTALRDDAVLAGELVRFAFKFHRSTQRPARLNDETMRLLAALAERQRQLEEAETFYRECLRTRMPQTEHTLYSGLLRVLRKQRKYDDIIKLCREGLVQSPGSQLMFYHDLALALAHKGQIDQALTEVERGLVNAADAARFAFRQLKVSLLTMAERFDKAEAECQAMLKEAHQPGEMLDVHYLLSTVYSSAHRLGKAEEELELVLKMDPTNPTGNNDLGYIWADQGKNLKRAEEMIRRAIELDRRQRKHAATVESDEDNAAYLDSLGWVLFRRGQLESARHELERAIALPDGDDPTIYDHLGDVYYRLEQFERARTAWRQALTLYERDRLRTMDQKYKDLKRKYKLLDSARQP
jgi:tetratricopeptide (TPR) repeat protein